MPVQLATPISMGDLGDPITHAKIIRYGMELDNQRIHIRIAYGRMSGSVFTAEPIKEPVVVTVRNIQQRGEEGEPGYQAEDLEYDDLMAAATPEEGELTYAAVKRGLYELIMTKSETGCAGGTIV